jgi:hypothetical protein
MTHLPILLLMAIMASVITTVSVPMLQQTYAQQQNNSNTSGLSQSLSELINSLALLIGVVAPLIISGLAYLKAKSQDPKIRAAADTGIYVGRLATATSNKALENKQTLKELIDFSLKIAPEEANKMLLEKKNLVEQLNKEIQATQAQIKRLTPMIPGKANADTISDLPRESNF